MNDLISRQAAYYTLAEYYHLRTEEPHKSIKEALSRVPNIDAVPVVRCKDCKWCEKSSVTDMCICTHKFGLIDPILDDYCSYGERREDEAD